MRFGYVTFHGNFNFKELGVRSKILVSQQQLIQEC